MSDNGVILVTGAGGFIGGHLVQHFVAAGNTVRAVDCKPLNQWFQLAPEAQNLQLDLSEREACVVAVAGARQVFNLAADMGGMGFIEANKARCMLSVLTNTHLLLAAAVEDVERFFYASSACVYAAEKQRTEGVLPLREEDAYPAMPEDGYGWEKLFSERMCRHFTEDFGLATRVARYHNVYGPYGTYDGGREKAPAALCRKIIQAKLSGDHRIEIWGDGQQTRSFTYVDDCITGTLRIMACDSEQALNLGSDRLVSINQLVSIIEGIAGIRVRRQYKHDAPQGVRGRNSDNTLLEQTVGWVPTTTLTDGLERTYAWIYDQMTADRLSSASA